MDRRAKSKHKQGLRRKAKRKQLHIEHVELKRRNKLEVALALQRRKQEYVDNLKKQAETMGMELIENEDGSIKMVSKKKLEAKPTGGEKLPVASEEKKG